MKSSTKHRKRKDKKSFIAFKQVVLAFWGLSKELWILAEKEKRLKEKAYYFIASHGYWKEWENYRAIPVVNAESRITNNSDTNEHIAHQEAK